MKIKIPFGFRRCYNCQVNVKGRRTQTCPTCGGHLGKNTPIPMPTATSEASEATKTVFSYPEGYKFPDDTKGIQLIHIPAGECPIKISVADGEVFPSDDSLREWGGDVRQAMINKGLYLRNSGLIFWARTQLNRHLEYAPRGEEMLHVGKVLMDLPDITTRTVPA